MEFFEHLTAYIQCKREGLPVESDPSDFYKRMLNLQKHGALNYKAKGSRLDTTDGIAYKGNMVAGIASEFIWYEQERPYYKVWPAMASMMSEVSIDIPPNALQFPYNSFAILLSNSPENDMRDEGGPLLRSINVFSVRVDSHENDEMAFKYQTRDALMQSGTDRGMYITYIFDGSYENEMYCFNYMLDLDTKHGTIENFFERATDATRKNLKSHKFEYAPSVNLVRRVVKLAVATCFFGIDQHEVVLPDLPRKKIEAKFRRFTNYSDAADHLKKSRQNTKKWTIGREIALPLPIIHKHEVDTNDRREISHGYVRRGHMRWQALGEGRKLRKLIFIHPHMCRPDLPLASHGYRIPDENIS